MAGYLSLEEMHTIASWFEAYESVVAVPVFFFLWDFVKDRLYGMSPQSLNKLRDRTTNAVQGISRTICAKAMDTLVQCFQTCIE